MKTLVIGLGNPILTDDGVGVKVAYQIQEDLCSVPHPDIDITEASVGGLHLMETMIGYDQVFIIDAIILEHQPQPGKVQRMAIDDLRNLSPTQHSASAHDTTLVTALDMAKRIGLSIPTKIVIYAIEVENVLEFSETTTSEVSKSIPFVAQKIIDELAIDYNLSIS
ncbi:MAG TPA: hydrogenase maturation protease [Anaerolineae bacterium]|nr:hydrogenase maturation protease [Anaerolineae bacterium]